MALKKEVRKNIYGKEIVFEEAYHRIDTFQGTSDYAEIKVAVYDDEQKQNVLEQRTYTFVHSVADDAFNIIKQGYLFLVTLPEYKDAIMVLENGQTFEKGEMING